ncbi:hypothetical protein [Chengkuizengella marina]|uniref:Uncharacterized protein n=1 Tax=Chengkuizengella marina TaxID=2507566 RepID=A0A6N9Q0W6_9BACL|nr:hypothetical protein [Chengkuizengella marina]NBI28585.1 hypothetical protein [Chengkuizengella marina]
MNQIKKKIIVIILFTLIVLIATFIITKPDKNDFVNWFEDEYDIKCYDPKCDTIILKLYYGEISKSTALVLEEESYSNGLFNIKLSKLYRGLDDRDDSFFIDVEGSLGKFNVVEQWEKTGKLKKSLK